MSQPVETQSIVVVILHATTRGDDSLKLSLHFRMLKLSKSLIQRSLTFSESVTHSA